MAGTRSIDLWQKLKCIVMNSNTDRHKGPGHWLERLELLIGNEKMDRLKNSNVLVAGLGGVGAYAAENICRAGVGRMTIADGDIVKPGNINRQLPALHSSVGRAKALLMAERLTDINPDLRLRVVNGFLNDENLNKLVLSEKFDYVVDAIDTLSPKIYLIYRAIDAGLPLVSSMGAGGKLDPSRVTVCDISETHNCRLAYILRKRLRKLGVSSGFSVVFSSEQVDRGAVIAVEGEQNKKSTVGTVSYMPPLFGCYCASVVIRGLLSLPGAGGEGPEPGFSI